MTKPLVDTGDGRTVPLASWHSPQYALPFERLETGLVAIAAIPLSDMSGRLVLFPDVCRFADSTLADVAILAEAGKIIQGCAVPQVRKADSYTHLTLPTKRIV